VTPLLEFREVAFAYATRDGRPGFAIRDLSFSVEAGEIFGVIGPNASGKTTLTRLLSKVLEPAGGEILLGGQPLDRLRRPSVARQVAVVPQDATPGFPFTVEDLVLMGRSPHSPRRFFEGDLDLREARQAMAAAGVLELRAEPLDRLSGGERQRVMLARALCQRAPLLVLDEPTAHLDLRHQAECVELLRRLNRGAGLTIVLISHDLNLAAELCDRLLLMRSGSAVQVGPAEVILSEPLLESVFGCRVAVDKHPTSRRPTGQVVWPDLEGGDRRS
jgi:iron complex transport system ATP-binding protein